MRVYVSVDMEGVAGVVHYEQTSPRGVDYEPARRWMTAEANAAIAGALAAGAGEVVVSDGHGGNAYRSLRLDLLDPRASLVTGSPHRPGGQMAGLDEGFAAVLLVGYHTRQGAEGVLSHTTNGGAVAGTWLNGVEVGECGLNMALAAHYGVPTVLVTGDDRTVAEVQALVPELEGVPVKWAISQFAARTLHPEEAARRIAAGAERALRRRDEIPPWRVEPPVTVRLRYKDPGSVIRALGLSGVRAVADDTVEITCPDMAAAYGAYRALVGLAVPRFGVWEAGGGSP